MAHHEVPQEHARRLLVPQLGVQGVPAREFDLRTLKIVRAERCASGLAGGGVEPRPAPLPAVAATAEPVWADVSAPLREAVSGHGLAQPSRYRAGRCSPTWMIRAL